MARSISPNRSVIVGQARNAARFIEAFRWEEGAAVGLGDVSGSRFFCSTAFDTSADGSVIVGLGNDCTQASVWTATDGMRSLQGVLVNDFGLDLTGWTLGAATAISADGLTIVGNRTNTDRESEGWIARLPAAIIEVEIDIKPGSDPNPINLLSRGVIPVAILGTETFDVADVDVSTLAFGPNGAAPAHPLGGHPQDVNGDGLTDLLSHYCTRETGIVYGDTEACVIGETLDGTPLEGCDAISTTIECGDGYAAALVVLPLMWIGRRSRRKRS